MRFTKFLGITIIFVTAILMGLNVEKEERESVGVSISYNKEVRTVTIVSNVNKNTSTLHANMLQLNIKNDGSCDTPIFGGIKHNVINELCLTDEALKKLQTEGKIEGISYLTTFSKDTPL